MGVVEAFDDQSTLRSAVRAAELAGVKSAGAALIRLGENAVFRLPEARVIARVGRSVTRAVQVQREIDTAVWLKAAGVSVAAPVVEVPVEVDGRIVTFWEEIPEPRPATPGALGTALRELHGLRPPDGLGLPVVEPLARVRERIAAAPGLPEGHRESLLVMASEAGREVARARFDLRVGLVHGDGHVDNLVRGADGVLRWVDLEECAIGQPEWDLVLTAIEQDCGWVSEREYAQFCDAYGYDVTASPGYGALRRVRLIRMTSWLAQKYAESETVAAEVRRRIGSLENDDRKLNWSAY